MNHKINLKTKMEEISFENSKKQNNSERKKIVFFNLQTTKQKKKIRIIKIQNNE